MLNVVLCLFQLFDLEERRKESMENLAVIIQKTFRGWLQRTKVDTLTTFVIIGNERSKK